MATLQDIRTWPLTIPAIQACFNNSESAPTGVTPNEAAIGFSLNQPLDLGACDQKTCQGTSPGYRWQAHRMNGQDLTVYVDKVLAHTRLISINFIYLVKEEEDEINPRAKDFMKVEAAFAFEKTASRPMTSLFSKGMSRSLAANTRNA